MTAENYFIKDQNAVYYLTFTVVDWGKGLVNIQIVL